MGAATEEQGKFGEATKFGDATKFGGDEVEAAEKKAVECSIKLERAELEFGPEFGRAMIDLRNKKKAAGERDWMAYLERLGIDYDLAYRWMNRVEKKETRHGKRAETSRTEPLNTESPKGTLASWERIADEFKVVVDHALILQNSQPVGEPFRAQLANQAKRVLKLAGGDNA